MVILVALAVALLRLPGTTTAQTPPYEPAGVVGHRVTELKLVIVTQID